MDDAQYDALTERTGDTAQALLRDAGQWAEAAAHFHAHLRAALFPLSAIGVSDEAKSLITGFMRSLTADADAALDIDPEASGLPHDSASLLGALFDDPLLSHYLFARTVEWRMHRAGDGDPQPHFPPLLAEAMGQDDGELAELAMAWLVAQSRFVSDCNDFRHSLDQMPAHLVHRLVWRRARQCIAADMDRSAVHRAARDYLARYEEGASRPLLGARFFQGVRVAGLVSGGAIDIDRIGFTLAAAEIARRADCDPDRLWTMLAEPGLARFAVLLRAIETPSMDSGAVLERFRAAFGDDAGSAATLAGFSALDQAQARDILQGWRVDALLAGEPVDMERGWS